jgi:hypothetical protein
LIDQQFSGTTNLSLCPMEQQFYDLGISINEFF